MKTMEEVIAERRARICEEQLRAAQSALREELRAQTAVPIVVNGRTIDRLTLMDTPIRSSDGWFSTWYGLLFTKSS